MREPRILYDTTHLIAFRGLRTPTGIPRVDLAYASQLTARPERMVGAARYGLLHPHMMDIGRITALAAEMSGRWGGDSNPTGDANFANVRNFLIGDKTDSVPHAPRAAPVENAKPPAARPAQSSRERFDPPQGAVYLNVAQYQLECWWYFRWLQTRPDVKAVFMLHDLLPFDFPQYFGRGDIRVFHRRIATMRRYADALIVSCETTRKRVAAHFAEHGIANIPIHVQPLPPDKRFLSPVASDPALAAAPYAIMVGTIEPRKNHILLLKLWQKFAESGRAAPRLLVVGPVGWKTRAALDLLKAPALQGRVMHVSGLSDGAYRHFLGHARALLQPSFMEGYGLPLVEAGAAGTPVIASDLEVFREVCQGKGEFLSPIDEDAWRGTILALADPEVAARRREAMAAFKTPTWETYMDGVLDFVSDLVRSPSIDRSSMGERPC